jgi:hypothetical protein
MQLLCKQPHAQLLDARAVQANRGSICSGALAGGTLRVGDAVLVLPTT